MTLVNLLLTVPLAAASWHLMEKPVMDWLHHRTRAVSKAEPNRAFA
jgi:peptidoglycan/LPS O-acetylase OafA/YrhL